MIPGRQSKITEEEVASAASIVVKADLVRITGVTQIDNIYSPLLTGRDGVVVGLVATNAAGCQVSAAGNVAVAQLLAQNRLYLFMFSSVANKWYPHGVA